MIQLEVVLSWFSSVRVHKFSFQKKCAHYNRESCNTRHDLFCSSSEDERTQLAATLSVSLLNWNLCGKEGWASCLVIFLIEYWAKNLWEQKHSPCISIDVIRQCSYFLYVFNCLFCILEDFVSSRIENRYLGGLGSFAAPTFSVSTWWLAFANTWLGETLAAVYDVLLKMIVCMICDDFSSDFLKARSEKLMELACGTGIQFSSLFPSCLMQIWLTERRHAENCWKRAKPIARRFDFIEAHVDRVKKQALTISTC